MKNIPYFTFDTETDKGFSGNAIMAQYYLKYNGKVLIKPTYKTAYSCITESLDHISEVVKKNGFNVARGFIHNLSFDLMRIINTRIPMIVFNSGTLVIKASFEYKDVHFDLVDSYNILPSSLKKLSESFLPEDKRKREIDILEKENFNILDDTHLEYAIYDVISLMEIIEKYSILIDVKPSMLASTASSQAFRFLKRIYALQAKNNGRFKSPKGTWKPTPKSLNIELREKFYFGGRVYIRNGHDISELNDVVSLDITSSYPAQMSKYKYPLPGSEPVRYKTFPKNVNGRYFVVIDVIDYYQDLPMIPYRDNNLVYYPHGSFRAYLSDLEFELIKETYKDFKYKIVEVLMWGESKCFDWMKLYIDTYYKLKLDGDMLNKKEKGSGDALRTIGKLFLNSVYGKFAQKYEFSEPMVFNGYEYTEKTKESLDHRNPHLSAFITSAARVQLYKAIIFYGAENVIYSDTDSIKVKKDAYLSKGKMIDENNELGSWKNEGLYNNFILQAPKVYASNTDDVVDIKAKGLMLNGLQYINGYKVNDNYVYDKKLRKRVNLDKYIYDLITKNDDVICDYGDKPVKMKTFIKNRDSYVKNINKSITQPEKVTGYTFLDNKYYIKVI